MRVVLVPFCGVEGDQVDLVLGLRGVFRRLSARPGADLGGTEDDQLDLVLVFDQKEDDQLDLVLISD